MRIVTKLFNIVVLIALFSHLALAQTADEIVEKYLTAIGGRTALGKLQSRHMSGTITLSTPAGNIAGTVEVFNQVPNKSRTLMKIDLSVAGMGEATIDQRFNGESGIALDTLQGNRDITGNQLENLKNATFPTPFLNFKDRGATVELVRKEPVGDRDSYVILLKPKSGSVLQCFIDAESYLLLKTVV